MAANILLSCIKKLLPSRSRRERRLSARATSRRGFALRPTVEVLEDRVTPSNFLVTDISDNAGSASDVTLRYAITTAVNGDTVTFDPSLNGGTITTGSTLAINTNITITGPGASQMAVNGNNAHGVFSVGSGVTATITGITVTNGAAVSGGGIYNNGTLTLTNDAITGNGAANNNTTNHYGAGIWSNGTLDISSSTISGNNSYSKGGGVYNAGGTLTLTNSTVTGNAAYTSGGGIWSNGTLTLTSDTIAGNVGWGGPSAGNPYAGGGGVYNGGTMTMDNTIVTGNAIADVSGSYTGSYDLVGGVTGLATSLASNGGPTQTLALSAGSSAIGAGDPAQAGTTSQNGILRPTVPDVGAFESLPPTLTSSTANLPVNSSTITLNGTGFYLNAASDTVTFDNGVTGSVISATATSMLVSLTGLSSVPVGTVLNASATINGNSTGAAVPVATVGTAVVLPVITASTASVADTSTTILISGSNFDTTAANNTVVFNLGVTGTVTAATATQLTVTVSAPPTALGALTAVVTTNSYASGLPVQVGTEVNGTWVVASSSNGAGSFTNVTLPYAVATALSGDTITFASSLSGSVITTAGTLTLANSVTITGLGVANLAVSGNNAHQVFLVNTGVTASISGLTIENGLAGNGAGIYNNGTLTLTGDAVSNNGSLGNTTIVNGAGIFNAGTLTVSNSTISGNSAYYNGGGLYNTGTATLTNTTIAANAAYTTGGGIGNHGTLTLTSDTIARNIGWAGNTGYPYNGGGGVYNGGTMTMDNTIVTGNNVANVTGSYTGSYNLLGSAVTGLATSLASNGGPTQTLALAVGSSAIGAGDPAQGGTTSQNGIVRPVPPDVGAYEALPTVTPSTANLPANAVILVITGSGFDITPANDVVTFDNGVTGTVSTATSSTLFLTVTGLGSVATGTALNASVTIDGVSSGAPVQVATLAAAATPSVTASTANLADNSTTITIAGSNFSTAIVNDTVTFNLGLVGTITSATATQLTVAISAPPTSLGNLTAVVTSYGLSTGAPVQVATEVNGTWVVTDSAGSGGSLSDVTLPYAVASALSGDTIGFASSLSGKTIITNSTLTLHNNVTITGAGAPNLTISSVPVLPNIPGLQYRLDASNAASLVTGGMDANGQGLDVTQWNDLSGNSNNFSTAIPGQNPVLVPNAIGGLPALQFYNDNLGTPMSGASNVNAQTVIMVNFISGLSNCCDGIWGMYGTDQSIRVNDGAGGTSFYGSPDGGGNNGDYTTIGSGGSTWISEAGSFDRHTTAVGPLGTNNILVATGNITPATTQIGGGSYDSRYFRGDVGEVLVYNTQLTTAQRQAVETYLTQKWLLGATAPHQVFNVASGVTASISGLTIANGSAASGGGLANAGTLTLSNDTFSNNSATVGAGGGIDNTGTLTVDNSTVTGNTATGSGGGIYSSGTLTLHNDTIAYNTGVGAGGVGVAGTTTVQNTLIAGNTGGDITGTYTGGFNVLGNATGLATTLANNGGTSPTLALSTSSPAIGTGGTGALPTDQRGIVRSTTAPDVGAFELQTITPSTASLPVTATTLTINGTAFDTTLANDTVTFDDGVTGVVTAATSTSLTVTLTGLVSVTGGTHLDAVVTVDGVASGSPVQVATAAPVITPSTNNLPANAPTVFIAGFGFDTNVANDIVTFDNGVTGVVASATATVLTITPTGLSTVTPGTALHASIVVDGTSNGSPVQVATVSAAATPTITLNTANLADSSATITINGSNFDPFIAGDTVVFNLGVVGAVTSATATQLTVALSAPPTALGSLTAVVTSYGISSGAPVQVATEVNGDWVVTDPASSGGGLSDVTLPYALANSLSGDAITFASSLSGATITMGSTITLSHNVSISGAGAPNLKITAASGNAGLVGTYFNLGASGSLIQPASFSNASWLGNQTPAVTTTLLGPIDFPNISTSGFTDTSANSYYNIPGNNNNVEGRWYGDITVPGTGTTPVPIRFATTSDDGSILYIDGNVVVNNNFFQGPTLRSGLVNLTPGLHTIDVEYYQGGGGASMTAQWDTTGGTTFTDIPNASFYLPGQVFNVPTGVTASISNLTVENGSAASGGGLANAGTLTLSNDTFTGNSAANGGAILNTGALTVSGATITHNSSTVVGGGIANSGALTVVNSTIANNSSVSAGGIGSSGTLTLTNDTIAYNSASSTAGGVGSTGTMTIQNTIVGGNTGGDVVGAYTDGGNNLIANTTGLATTLASNGGPTQTLNISLGSPAIGAGGAVTAASSLVGVSDTTISVTDAAAIAQTPGNYYITIGQEELLVTSVNTSTNTLTVQRGVNGTLATTHASGASVYLANDQRGFTRQAPPAIGAVDANVWIVTDPNGNAGSGSFSDVTLPFAINAVDNGLGLPVIEFASNLSGDTITLNSTLNITANVTITGLGAANLTVTGNNAVGVFNVASGVTAGISGLTITGGSSVNGGGVSNAGALTLTDVAISGNTASGDGSGIYDAATGSLTLASTTTTTVSDNIFNVGGLGVTLSGTGAINVAGNINLGLGTLTDSSSGPDAISGVISQGGVPTSYVGFTGGTGGANSVQHLLNWTYTSGATNIDYSGGFATNNLTLNGGLGLSGSALALTDGNNSESRAAWVPTAVPISDFTSTFEWTYGANPQADGFTFAVQNSGPTALGSGGGGLGYMGIAGAQYAVEFNLYQNVSTFGVGLNGAISHSIDLTASGINFHANPTDIYKSTVVANGATLTVSIWDTTTNSTATPNFTQTFAIPVQAGVGLLKTGTGTLTLSNANTYGGATSVTGGVLNLGNNTATSAGTVTVAATTTLNFAAGVTSPVLGALAGAGNITLTTAASEPVTLNIGSNGSSTTYGGVLSGTGGFTKQGAGTLSLIAQQTYGGATLISAGEVKLPPAPPPLPNIPGLQYQLDASNAASLVTGGMDANGQGLDVTQWNDLSGNSNNFSTAISGQNPVLVPNAFGNLPALQFYNDNLGTPMSGASNVNAQTVIMVNFISGVSNCCDGIWGMYGADQSIRVNDGTGGTSFYGNPDDGGNSGDYTTIGSGGSTWISEVGSFDHNTTAVGPLGTANILVATGNITPATTQIGGGSYDSRYFRGDVGEVLVYNTQLTTAQRQAVETYLSDKWLLGASVLPNPLPTTTTLTVAAGATLDLQGQTQQVAGITGSGSVIDSSNSPSSGLTVTGTAAPGTAGPGVLTTAKVTLPVGSTMSVDITGATVGTQYDQLIANGPVTLGGALSVNLGSYVPPNGTTFDILANNSGSPITGNFTLGATTLTEGSTFTVGTQQFTITYLGGASGADVVLTAVTIGGTAPAVSSVVINGGAPAYTDSNGLSFSLAGQNSVVEQILVTFNEAVTLDPGAFTITNDAAGVTVNNGPTPNTAAVSASFAAVAGSGNTQFIVTFSGPGTNVIPGGVGNVIKDGLYILNTIGSHVHANSQTAADNNTTFWALYGSVVGSDNNLSSTIGDGTSEVFVDNFDYSAFKSAFGAETDIPTGVPYNVGLDGDLNGFIDNFDYSQFKGNFGADWSF